MDLSAPGMERVGALSIEWCATGRGVPEDLQDASEVLQKVASLIPEPEAIPTPPSPIPTIPSAKSAIESILKKLRREDLEPNAHIVRASRSSAA